MNYEDMTLQELKNAAKELGIKGVSVMKKDELTDLLNAVKGHQKETVKKEKKETVKADAVDVNLDSGKEANGILEVMSDGFGFIRCENYLPGENDIYVSPAQIKRFNLKTGDIVIGNQKVKTEKEKFAALLYIKSINGYSVG